MKCKNCDIDLKSEDYYCCSCGAMVINKRITSKSLISDLVLALGWDSQFWTTTRDLLIKPGQVLVKYLNGTRKKYSSPFAFFAIVTTITVLFIGFYTNEMIDVTTNFDFAQTENVSEPLPHTTNDENIEKQVNNISSADTQIFIKEMATLIFKYYYYISFLMLPLYAFIAFLVYGKPNNFAEHLVINSYIIGFVSLLGLLLFTVYIITKTPEIYYWGQYVLTIFYYPYAYKNYRNYSRKQSLLKILRFLVIIILFIIAIFLLIFIIAIAVKFITSRF